MARKREIASSFDNKPSFRMVANSDVRPDNPIEALMQCPPGIDPDPSREELLPLRDILQDAIEKLDPREQWIWDALTSRRLSMRALARELGMSKGAIQHHKARITTKLASILIESEEVRRYLCR